MTRDLTASASTTFAAGRIRLVVAAASIAVAGIVLGFVFAGSPNTLAPGTRIAGVPVGGLTTKDARALLQRRSAQLADVPVAFTADGKSFSLRPAELGVAVNWSRAVAAADQKGEGLGVIRGYRRLALRLFPADIAPKVRDYDAAVQYEVGLIAAKVDRPARDARLVRHGVDVTVQQGQAGELLDRTAAARTIVAALAGFGRTPVALPLVIDQPNLTAVELAPERQLARRIVSAPVTMVASDRRIVLAPAQLAAMLRLPNETDPHVTLGGPEANRYFAQLARTISHAPADASFAVEGAHVRITPAQKGTTLDVVRSAAAVLAAAERPAGRVANLVVVTVAPKRTTAEARAMGITGIVGSYETIYGGIANRIHNVQLVAHLVDDKLIAPGATFSFNQTTGERNAAKGFLEAPVIVNGELTTGLGGGVCQVSTTVFNAAFDAGLKITERTNHALYISHYPQGRDATVDYPGVDMKFVNDTSHWLLLRTFVGSSSLTVNLYGTPTHRRVESTTAPLVTHGVPPVKKTVDPSLQPGEKVVDDNGVPAMSTSVERKVYDAGGKLLYDDTWYSSYRAEPKLVRIAAPKEKQQPATTTTAPTTTQP
jgi:vancomycin resistance protein YoaR